ncbi:MAG: hypothetical protein K1562_13415 [Candidatus Thiodiazotropha sp. (ex. Lucinisca nassula)]|nr:hypothetical protein [Candidatus Thiodiazotropha sp. (ex. Lucinisca nassula)]
MKYSTGKGGNHDSSHYGDFDEAAFDEVHILISVVLKLQFSIQVAAKRKARNPKPQAPDETAGAGVCDDLAVMARRLLSPAMKHMRKNKA